MGKGYGVFSPLRNKYFNRLILKSREKHNVKLISRFKVVQFIVQNENLEDSALYGFINDQSPRMRKKMYWRKFMGVKVPVFTGAERLAHKFNFPVFFVEIDRIKRGYYTTTFSVLAKNPSEFEKNKITDLYIERLESQIRRDPTQYLWSHNRFKHRNRVPIDQQ